MKCKKFDCENEVIQPQRGRRRLFCSPACTKAFWNAVQAEEKRTGARSDDHRMSDVDPETQMGVCSQCGPVKAYSSGRPDGRRRWRCSKRVRAQASVSRYNEKLDPIAERVRKMRGNGVDITVEEFQQLTAEQAGHCALCDQTPRQLHMDHNHETGRPRGLLCSTCNTGLGKFGDDPDRLEAAAAYLRARS